MTSILADAQHVPWREGLHVETGRTEADSGDGLSGVTVDARARESGGIRNRQGAREKRRAVSDLAVELRQSTAALSHTLRRLRDVDIARYEARGRNKSYWIKEPRLLALLRQVERMVKRMRFKAW